MFLTILGFPVDVVTLIAASDCRPLMQDGDIDDYLSVKANKRARDHAEKSLLECGSISSQGITYRGFDTRGIQAAVGELFLLRSLVQEAVW